MKKWNELEIDELIFELPLYRKIEIDWITMQETLCEQQDYSHGYYNEYVTNITEEYENLLNFIQIKKVIYGNCPCCQKGMGFSIVNENDLELDSNFRKVISYVDDQIDGGYIPEAEDEMKKKIEELLKKASYFDKKFQCPVCKAIYCAAYKILFEDENLYLMKIGQYPSLHEFSKFSTNAYDKLLKKMNAKDDFRNAKKMNIDGYNIAAYTYLRRVLEKIILYVFNENKEDLDCDYSSFKTKHLDEKLKVLKGYIPEFLYENKKIYSIVSAGIHILEEDICKEYYDTLQMAIEIILNQYEAKRKENILLEKTSSKLSNIADEIKKTIK